MRLHHLTLTAIGPFAGTERVDFDELAAAGVFLVTGATGAGKSSLLDAVCFALYGVVPGPRGVKALRSDHAAPDLAPEVVLDFSVAGRRFVVRRSPEWSRPRRSGSGVTTVRASASLLETTGGVERLVSSRAQEVGHTVSGLLQLSSTQFQQVVLLPQGGFATFLRASSQERHDVLQQLFHTRRFADIETWVHERSRGLRAAASASGDDVRRHAHTLSYRAGRPLPHDVDDDALAAAGAGPLQAWADRVVAAVDADAAHARVRRRSAEQERDRAADTHDRARRRAELGARRDAARAALAALDQSSADAARATAALADAERAARVMPLLGLLDEADRTASACAHALAGALRRLPGPVRSEDATVCAPDAAALAMLHIARRDTLSRMAALLPRESELREAERALEEAAVRLRDAGGAAGDLTRRRAALPGRLRELGARLDAVTAEAARLDSLAAETSAARRVHEAAAALPGARADALDARAAAVDARARAVAAQDRLLALVERRLAGMAAELASSLVDGSPCPVCGSPDHPRATTHPGDPVAAEDIAVARLLVDSRQAEATEAEHAAAEAAARAQRVADAAAGHDEDSARRQLAELTLAAERASVAAGHRDTLSVELERLRESEHDLSTRLQLAVADEAAAQARHDTAEREAGRLSTELAEALEVVGWDRHEPATAPPRLSDLVEKIRTEAGLLDQAASAARTAEQATAERDRLRARADAAAAQEGFACVAQARTAVLPPADRERLETLLGERGRQRERVAAVLGDQEVAELDESPAVDPSVTESALGVAEAECAEATRVAHLAEETQTAATHAAESLRAALRAWLPRRDEAATAETMARLVRGTGADNRLQMRLSAYVLATRLDQVVAAANERLGHMREHRYLLARTARAARKGAPTGLGLQVLDLWTGDARDPATLSGGETFVVSLALALGLADVVTHEAGGVQLQTLFVDEGFGMLDADTLDDVMDRLDGLRSGGRTVGVVSHVSELRGRIPVQLHVHKLRGGSRVEVRTLVA